MNSLKPTLYLLDAFALIYRAYYAFIKSPRINSKGENVSAIYGFTSAILDIIKTNKPDYIAVAFEHPEGNFRTSLYKEYKAQREVIPEDILFSIPKIMDLLHTMEIPSLSVKGLEADDIIGVVANQAEKEGFQVYMVTPDKDYCQLVTDNCHILKPTTNGFEELDQEKVCQKYLLKRPNQMIDYLGLVGDTSDNIPGCKGIGPKSANILLKEFDTIEEIYNNLDKIKPIHKKKLEENRENTFLSKKLVTIVTSIPDYIFPLKEYKLNWRNKDNIVAKLQEYEFPSLIKRYFSKESFPIRSSLFASLENEHTLEEKVQQKPKIAYTTTSLFGANEEVQQKKDLNKNTKDTKDEFTQKLQILKKSLSFETLPMKHTIIETDEQYDLLWKRLSTSQLLAFDTETTSTDSLQCELVAVSLSPTPGEVYYLPIPQEKEKAKILLAPLNCLMQNENIIKVAQNAKFDTQVLSRYGINYPKKLFDTLLAHYLVDSERPHNLDAIALEYLGHRMIPYSDLSSKKNFSLRKDVDPNLLAIYASEDADVTCRLKPILSLCLKKEEQTDLFNKIEMPLLPILSAMEQTGVAFDKKAIQQVEKNLETEIEHLSESIYSFAKNHFNINSPIQVGEILFDKLKIDSKPKKTKSGTYATGEEILLKYVSKHPIVQLILDYRGATKLLNTYVKSLSDYVFPDGRIHCHFNQAVTATGRLSCSNPNLQNIPIRSALGQEIRTAFVASDETHIFLSADYSQVELRLAAHISKDSGLINAINAGEDIHRETASKLYHIPSEEVTASQRSFAKTANFGILYGITGYGLSQRLHISLKESNELIENYFQAFPGILNYMEKAKTDALNKGYAETLLGRRRYLPDMKSQNAVVRGNAERIAINTPIQGTAADLIKVAMVNIYKRMKREGYRSKMILQIHDELCFDALKDEVSDLSKLIKEEMMQAIGVLSVPLDVSIGTGYNWLLAH